MTYSIRTAKESEATKINEEWGSLNWVASKATGNTKNITVGRVTIKKGQSNPRHSHSNCEEVLYLLSGQLEHSIGDETVILRAGDTLVIGPGIAHNAINIGDEDADMIVAYSSGVREFQLET
mgnify:CR=1 FL=1